MALAFQFGIIGDPHIGLPQTIWDHPSRFHLIEVSIPALEQAFEHFAAEQVDFVLIPGDLTQHGERENHQWLADRLSRLPFPVYVVPGNHDVVQREPEGGRIGLGDFAPCYRQFGYGGGEAGDTAIDRGEAHSTNQETDRNSDRPYYCRRILPGVRLIGLNSNQFDTTGQQNRRGSVDTAQLAWLRHTLTTVGNDLVLLMIHHNVIAHLPNQDQHPLGQRYQLANHADLLAALPPHQVPFIFTGHLHIQDIALRPDVTAESPQWEITTGSLVSYPHPYRICQFEQDDSGDCQLKISSPRITAVLPDFPDLQGISRQWMGDRSPTFMGRLLMAPPLNLTEAEATPLVPALRDFWADIADGNPQFDFPTFPEPARQFCQRFSDPWAESAPGQRPRSDNNTVLSFRRP